MQALLELLEQDPALAVHDRLRQARRARGVEHPQRVVERHLLELSAVALVRARAARSRAFRARARKARRRRRPGRAASRCAARWKLGEDRAHDLACGRSPCRRGGSRRPRAAPSARSGRSGRSRCARRTRARRWTRSRRCSQRPGTPPPSRGCSACTRQRDPRARRRASAARAAAAATCDASSPQVISPSSRSSEVCTIAVACRIVAWAQQVLRVVQLGAGEPLRPGHRSGRRARARRARGDHAEEIPDASPEVLELIDRPLPQLAVASEGLAAALAGPAHEARHLGLLEYLRLKAARAAAGLAGWTSVRSHSHLGLARGAVAQVRARWLYPLRRLRRSRGVACRGDILGARERSRTSSRVPGPEPAGVPERRNGRPASSRGRRRRRPRARAGARPTGARWRTSNARSELKDALRARYAALLGAQPADVSLTTCTTEGMAQVIVGLELGAGDEILTSDEEHPGLLGALSAARDVRGVSIRMVPLPRSRAR